MLNYFLPHCSPLIQLAYWFTACSAMNMKTVLFTVYQMLQRNSNLLWAQWQSKYSLIVSQVYKTDQALLKNRHPEDTHRLPLRGCSQFWPVGDDILPVELWEPPNCSHPKMKKDAVMLSAPHTHWAFRQRLHPLYSQVHHLWQHCIKRGPFRYNVG